MKLVTILVMLLLITACAVESDVQTSDAPAPTPTHTVTPTATATPEPVTDRTVLLEEFAQTWGDAIAKQEWAFAHALYPDEFKEKCPQLDFAGLMTFVWAFAGYPDDLEFRVDEVRIDGDKGWVDGSYHKNGVTIDILPSDDEEADEQDVVWKDGKWSLYMSPDDLAVHKPCELETDEE